MDFAWLPGGKYLMVDETTDAGGDGHDWAIFTSPAGVFAGPETGWHNYDELPMWSSDHPFCLIGGGLGATPNALDLSNVPPRLLSYLNSGSSGPFEEFGFDPAYSAFVPGTRDLVVLRPHDSRHCPV